MTTKNCCTWATQVPLLNSDAGWQLTVTHTSQSREESLSTNKALHRKTGELNVLLQTDGKIWMLTLVMAVAVTHC